MKKKVILGLSGGVDSSVAAIKLLEEGYEVVGVFMRNWDSATNNDFLGNPDFNSDVCPQEKDYQDAVKVAEKLGIELKRVDFIEEYWEYVFKYFLEEYAAGRTPNPDLMCNKEIKFKAFLDYANNLNADYIAMGHYARITHDPVKGSYLLRGLDNNKDQTYFLALLSQNQINKALFPVGDMLKKEVRELAVKYDLATATKKDSTGICFIGERRFHQFLQNYLPAKPGKMVRLNGEVIGNHDGLMYYTIGQRKGLGIGGISGYSTDPWFVVGKDLEKNLLFVEQGIDNDYLYSDFCIVKDLNWINEVPVVGKEYQAKFRYREKDNSVVITVLEDNLMHVKFNSLVRAVTPGQDCVIYDNEVCMGGGIINEVYRDGKKRKY